MFRSLVQKTNEQALIAWLTPACIGIVVMFKGKKGIVLPVNLISNKIRVLPKGSTYL